MLKQQSRANTATSIFSVSGLYSKTHIDKFGDVLGMIIVSMSQIA